MARSFAPFDPPRFGGFYKMGLKISMIVRPCGLSYESDADTDGKRVLCARQAPRWSGV